MTKRVAIAELEGAALDWAVAKAAGMRVRVCGNPLHHGHYIEAADGKELQRRYFYFEPTKDWSQCGPLKARYKVDSTYMTDGSVRCRCPKKFGGFPTFEEGLGRDEPTAACRAIVASHNPDGFVEVPEELTHG